MDDWMMLMITIEMTVSINFIDYAKVNINTGKIEQLFVPLRHNCFLLVLFSLIAIKFYTMISGLKFKPNSSTF